MRPEYLAHGITQPRPPAPRAAPEVAWVLMKDRRINRFRHVVSHEEVGIRCAQVPRIARSPLAKRRRRIGQLPQARKRRREQYGSPVEAVLCGDFELVFYGKRLIFGQAGRGSVVRNDAEKPLFERLRGLLARGGPGLSGTLRWLRLTQRENGKNRHGHKENATSTHAIQ